MVHVFFSIPFTDKSAKIIKIALLDHLGTFGVPRVFLFKWIGIGIIFHTQIQKNCADAIKSSKYHQKRFLQIFSTLASSRYK